MSYKFLIARRYLPKKKEKKDGQLIALAQTATTPLIEMQAGSGKVYRTKNTQGRNNQKVNRQ